MLWMRSISKLAVLSLAVVAIAWPGAGRSNEPGLAGTDWRIVEVAGKSVDAAGTVRFAANRVSGKAACNSFFATTSNNGGRITIGPIGTTRMYCDGKMVLERETLTQLSQVTKAERRGADVALVDATGRIVMVLSAGR